MNPPQHPPIGKLIKVGNHHLHIYSTGEGGPTVVLEAGGMGWSLDWHFVQTEVAKFTSVCSYDRAGFGWSEPGPTPRTADRIVIELHTLLAKAEVIEPYILVGASFGGHIVRLFANKYPYLVAGIILLDARHEAMDTKLPPAWKKLEKVGRGMNQVLLLASKIGLLNFLGKLMGEKAYPPIVKKLAPEIRPVYLKVGFQPKFFQSNLDEFAAIYESDKTLSTTGSLGNIPLIVIRHGESKMFASMPAEQAKISEFVWQDLQADLAKLSSNSHLFVAEKSGHNIQIDQPGFVVDAIRQMTAWIRSATSPET